MSPLRRSKVETDSSVRIHGRTRTESSSWSPAPFVWTRFITVKALLK